MPSLCKKLASGLGKAFLAVILVLILVFAVYAAYGIHAERSAARKAAAMCTSIAAGSDASSLQARAIADGASSVLTRWFTADGFDILLITYVGMPPFSRYLCRIKATGGRVISAEQIYID